ncbi:MAG: SMC-Scp complex subunit ScpB [Oscillospiraceae bacterium]|nr:SMC-Scp complex subunit ScpB [Oscillospiraceae bacterium]
MDSNELQRVIEAILFASGERIEVSRLSEVLEIDPDEIIKAADELANNLAFERRGIRVLKLENGYQMVSSGEMADYVSKALETRKPPKLSSSQLETLTIVAYYQPATKALVEQIRGVDSSYSVGALLNKKLIEEAGRLNVPGRPIQYKTTPDFLRTFGLKSLEDLPPIEKVNFGEPLDQDPDQLQIQTEETQQS